MASDGASFGFEADEAASFECRLDGGSWGSCTSPKSFSGLAEGSHTFEVRSVDAVGNTDATSASRGWTVDASGGDTSTHDDGGYVDPASDADTFAASIGALAKAGITYGCNPPTNDRFCPDAHVTRCQMAAFIRRALS